MEPASPLCKPAARAEGGNSGHRCLSSPQTKTFKVSLLLWLHFSPLCSLSLSLCPSLQTKIVSYPWKINIMGCRWQSLHSYHSFTAADKIPGFSPSFLFWCVLAQSCCSPVLRWVWLCEAASLCTAPFQFLRLCKHTSPFFFTSSLSLALRLSLSPSIEADEGWGWRGGSVGTQKALCLGSFHMVSFKLAYWTHYAIIYFHIQHRDVEGTVGPTLFSPPLSFPVLTHFPAMHTGQRNPNKEGELSVKKTHSYSCLSRGICWCKWWKLFPIQTPEHPV